MEVVLVTEAVHVLTSGEGIFVRTVCVYMARVILKTMSVCAFLDSQVINIRMHACQRELIVRYGLRVIVNHFNNDIQDATKNGPDQS